VCRTAVVSDKERRAGKQRFYFFQRRPGESSISCKCIEVFPWPGDEYRLEAQALIQMAGHFEEIRRRPRFIGRRSNGMQYSVRACAQVRLRKQTSPGNLALGHADMEHRRRDVLGGMDFAADVEDLLGAWNADVV
jgi:hypothetical protein